MTPPLGLGGGVVKIVPLRPSGGGVRPSLPIFVPNSLILSQFPKNKQVAPQFSAPRDNFQPLQGAPSPRLRPSLPRSGGKLPARTVKKGKKRLFVNHSKCFPRIFGDQKAKKATFCNKTTLDICKIPRALLPRRVAGMRDDFAFKGLFYGLVGLWGTPLLAGASRL